MRCASAGAIIVCLFSVLFVGTAEAVVVQIDGTVVPVGRVGTCPLNDVRCCLEVYEDPDDAVSPIHDARVWPGVFQVPCPEGCDSSECGIAAGCDFYTVDFEVLAEGAGYHNSFGWYNVGDDVTDTDNLFLVLDCRIGGSINCPDPTPRTASIDFQTEFELGNYDGGFIGMWLRTPELLTGGGDSDGCGSLEDTPNRIYFTEQALNDDGDFVHYLIWESQTLEDTYYFGWEDLFRGGDNDFEDMFFVAHGLVPPCDPQPETCNGEDDDCDGEIDEDLTRECASICGDGVEICIAGSWSDCDAPEPAAEICDGIDNDCNGEIDEGLTRACSTLCGTGSEVCFFGAWVDCDARLPTTEECNTVDDDCDGEVDESDPRLGEVCGEDRGACEAGALICEDGELVCDGWTGPTPELCNSIDDDCDGDVDEGNPGGGDPCGTDEGECLLGILQCIAGSLVCIGGRGPIDEVCNGLDDDCDGESDEGNPGGGAPCGSDVGACVPGILTCIGGRFECEGATGPTPEECNGIDDDCDGVIDDGLVRDCEAGCGPGNQICVDGEWGPCQGPDGNPEICNGIDDDCDGLIDEGFPDPLCPEEGMICIDGECVLPCVGGEFPCPPDRVCIDGYCVSGPCRDIECDENEVCIDGECVNLCGSVQCADGFVCSFGHCVEDNCYGLGCDPGEICLGGECIPNPCAGVECDENEFCRDGSCIPSCAGIHCPGGQTCRSGVCSEDPCARQTCSDGDVCIDGVCVPDPCVGVRCGIGRICLAGECVDDPCLHVTCPDGQLCVLGDCYYEAPGTHSTKPDQWGLATGNGGFTCALAEHSPQAPWFVLITFSFALLVLRRSRRRRRSGQGFLFFLVALVSVASASCTEDPYCFFCDNDQTDGGPDGGRDGSSGEGGPGDADVPENCIYEGEEECDGRDNDCDGHIDEGFDLNTDPGNCGSCGSICVIPHAFPRCVDRECEIDRCDVGWVDLDRLPGNGCEYECLFSGTEVCDGRDNDCDSEIDEGFNIENDINNCGACGVVCAFYHAPAYCEARECVMGECDPGFIDLDGGADTGCEYNCTPSGSGETCDGRDNDCDGEVDEGIDTVGDPLNCGACGRTCAFLNAEAHCVAGDCVLGECDAGWIDLDGVADSGCEYPCDGVEAEVCNGSDDDCDGLVDEDDPIVGTSCGSSTGDCIVGVWTCSSGHLSCEGGSSGTPEVCDGEDNDCDGVADNGNPGGGARCGLTNTGLCEYGTLMCTAGELVCGGGLIEPTAEVCDGEDNDCDGESDEGIAPRTCSTLCGSGTERCSAGAWIDCNAPPELVDLCDGEDNDCDGATDPGCPLVGPTEIWVENDSSNTVFPTLASDGATRVVVGYLDRRSGNAAIRVAGSPDQGTSWTSPSDLRLDTTGASSMSPVVALADDRAYMAWEDTRDGLQRSIYFRRSADGGASWHPHETRLDSGIAGDSFKVDMAAVNNEVYVVWQVMDWTDRSRAIYFTASTNGGASFSSPIRIDHHPSPETGIAHSPRIAAIAGGYVYIAFADNRFGPGAIMVNTSDDFGSTWAATDVRVDPSVVEAMSQSPVIATDGAGRVVVVWEDEYPDGLDTLWKIYGAVSEDDGATFSTAERLDDDPLPHDSREPALTIDPRGTAVHVVWRDMRNGLADIYHRLLDLASLSWNPSSTRVDTDFDGLGNSTLPQVAAGSDNRVWVVWEDDRSGERDIYINFSMDGGTLFQPVDIRLDSDTAGSADSHDPQVVTTADRAVIVWVDHRAGDGITGDLYSRTLE